MNHIYIGMSTVCELTDLAARDINKLLVKGTFPTPVKSAEGGIVWIKDEVKKWRSENKTYKTRRGVKMN